MDNEIHRETAALLTALARGDVGAAGAFYADGARVLTSSADLIQGRAAIEAYWRAGIDLGLSGIDLEIWALEEIGRSVLELGRYALLMQAESSMPLVDRGSYLALHTQTADGSWRRAVEVFNPDEPIPALRHVEKEEQ